MRLQVTAVGQRMPDWVGVGFATYARRMPPELQLELREVPSGDRGKGADVRRAREVEGERLLAAAPRGALGVALDARGRALTTGQLADALADWMQQGCDVALFVGGADGLCDRVLEASRLRLSLSRLTFPHMLVRVLMAEQLYRAWSILARHPYHR